jgi:hypothetical protein
MEWRRFIEESYADRPSDVRPAFREGASPVRLAELESALGLRLPAPLREILSQTDGVGVEMFLHDKWTRTDSDVWSCDQLEKRNSSIRADSDGPPPPPGADGVTPLYFAKPGVEGIVFAFFVHPSSAEDPAVYAYYPIEKAWRLISPTLEVHLRGWTV